MNCRHESFYDVNDMPPPPFLSQTFYTALPDIALIRALLVGKMAEFHWDHDSVGNQRGAKTGAQPNKKHQPSPVTAERRHGRIVDKLDRPRKGLTEVKSNPSSTQIVWLRCDAIIPNYAGIANGHSIVGP